MDAFQLLRDLELTYYRPFHRADLTDHNTPGLIRFGIADGLTDCADLAYFLETAYPQQIIEKADFTTQNAMPGNPLYGVPDGLVSPSDHEYHTTVLFPAGYPYGCP